MLSEESREESRHTPFGGAASVRSFSSAELGTLRQTVDGRPARNRPGLLAVAAAVGSLKNLAKSADYRGAL